MIFIRRSTLNDLLQILAVAGLCVLFGFSCINGKSKPVSTADVSIKVSSKKAPRTHNLVIVHPGDPEAVPMDMELVQYFDEEGEPHHYSLWVDSVICRDKTCEIVQVEIFWDAFGQYDKYFVEKGEDLTKLDHVPFSKEDHAKLQRILKDKESPLREVTKDGLVGQKAKSAVDGVAGATVLTLNSTVVVGAGYTCYDLWHWANGELTGIIRDISGKSASISKLKNLLKIPKEDTVHFAIDNLKKRKVFDNETRNAVIGSMKSGGDELIGAALEYLNLASKNSDEYFNAVGKIYADCSSNKRVFITTSLTKDTRTPPKGFYSKLSQSLKALQSYHEVHLLLTLFDKRKAWSADIEKNVIELISHPKFFFSRRAYWFLKDKKLTPENKQKLDAYYKKNQLRLL